MVSQWRSEARSGYHTVNPAYTQCGDQWGVLGEATALATLPSLSMSRGFMVKIASGGSGGSAGSLPAGYKRTSLAMDTTPAAAKFSTTPRPGAQPARASRRVTLMLRLIVSHTISPPPRRRPLPATSRRRSSPCYTPPLLTHRERFTSWTARGTVQVKNRATIRHSRRLSVITNREASCQQSRSSPSHR